MKFLLLPLVFIFSCCISCKSGNKISKNTNAATLDTITELNYLPAKKKAVFKTDKGEHLIMRYEPDPNDSIHRNGHPQASVSFTVSFLSIENKRCDSDFFDGVYRKESKLSISNAPFKTFTTLRKFMNTLQTDEFMANHNPPITTSSLRVTEENRNVKINTAYMYCYSKQTDEDFHVIIGTTKDSSTATYFNIEISGLPDNNDLSFSDLKATRDSFLTKADKRLCSSGYYFFETPKKIQLKGSLFFDKEHFNEKIGPASARPNTAWEIHPVTFLKYK